MCCAVLSFKVVRIAAETSIKTKVSMRVETRIMIEPGPRKLVVNPLPKAKKIIPPVDNIRLNAK